MYVKQMNYFLKIDVLILGEEVPREADTESRRPRHSWGKGAEPKKSAHKPGVRWLCTRAWKMDLAVHYLPLESPRMLMFQALHPQLYPSFWLVSSQKALNI